MVKHLALVSKCKTAYWLRKQNCSQITKVQRETKISFAKKTA